MNATFLAVRADPRSVGGRAGPGMDLLAAYHSDDEEENIDQFRKRRDESLQGSRGEHKSASLWCRDGKRQRLSNENSFSIGGHQAPQQSSSSLPFHRYVSKRERAALASASASDSPLSIEQPLASPSSSQVYGSVSVAKLPSRIMARLTSSQTASGIPKKKSVSLVGHTKAVNAVRWSPTHGHILASGGMDGMAYIWNVWNEVNQQKACAISFHSAAVKDVQWSKQRLHLLTCGYDRTSRLIDVETGNQVQVFPENQMVSVIKFHPCGNDIFLSGGSNGTLRLWDIRTNSAVHEFSRGMGAILDADFTNDGKQFACSSDVSHSNASEKSIVVWDVRTQVPVSKQVYVEAYTCPCIRYHPVEANFIAQSNGNYIALFSANLPFKLNKYKRFEGHQVSGFPIKCNFSRDGSILISGSADGYIYFYSYQSSKLLKRIPAYDHACIDVVFHGKLPSVVAACSWDGSVSVFE